ncbi:MAG: ATP-binding protein [Candidatus Cloacimonetes bacterium]|nr:ATP-binding protein [Candidatus Cloacimonadota bacterium]MDD4155205.1 ATP-binding protein [Candidatus Cloacimonadota bacterium]
MMNSKNKIFVFTKDENLTRDTLKSNDFFDILIARTVEELIKLMKTVPYKAIAVDSLNEYLALDKTVDYIDEQVPILLFHQNCNHLNLEINQLLKNQIWHFNASLIKEKSFMQFYLLHLTMAKYLQIDFCDCYHYNFKTSMEKIEIVAEHLNQYLKLILKEKNKIYDFYVNLILRELLTNAVKHGNQLDPKKNIYIIIYFSKEHQKIGILVKDEGKGFDFNKTFEKCDVDDLRQQQRGLFLIKKLCDKIFNHRNLIAVELYYTE